MESFASLLLLLCLILGVLFGTCDSFSSNEVSALTAFKLGVFEDPLQVFSNWNSLDSDPCFWSGIKCSPTRDHVVKINISQASIRGFLPSDFGQLNFLEELILHGNKLLGTVPKELGNLKNLRVLDLGVNELTGPIPPEFGKLTKVVKINLQSNGLTGKLPSELGNLRSLEELRLDRNKLEGTVSGVGHSDLTSSMHGLYVSNTNLTGFCRSSQLKFADFSYNFFVGSIPKCLGYLPRSSFQGNCLQKNNPKQRPSVQCAKSHQGSNGQNHAVDNISNHHQATSKPIWLLALEIVTGTLVGSLFLVAVLTAVQKFNRKSSIILPWKKVGSRKYYAPVYVDPEILKDVTRFSRQELELACEDFSNIIGSSPNSLVYKGTMKTGPEIAVISMSMKEEQWTGYLELYFQTEVADLARINHENTGKLLGYCRESSPFTRMLVFEYASNGTLYEHLHYGEACQLSWTRRMKIILGIARGLKYLHTELQPPFTISLLNSNAVYLTDDFFPKLIDFESWKTILSRSEKNSGAIGSQGAICVLPNSLEARHLDVQGNIYAFGVLLLEIISGRPLYCKDKGNLLDWAKDYIEMPEVMSYVVDPELKHFRYEDLEVICEVVNLCIHPQPSKSLSMKELCTMLETRIDTSVAIEFKASSLAWAELALS
ncbi:probable LRR receptor-like serine/threonine-protein kinase At1g63430 [Momordica charantia]|uniref:Probable LRR receptor-like serine/threonine-protein kinase At1g63430 n=1 Tax=Momordica charantia TaxID=3673 RepID=A0A6J1DPH6_MOMCH|nr:probable LRR receptor-like serine/threonine-protein kinase At1g63430 [Momordica charantia]